MGFFGGYILVRGFFGVLLEALGIFWVLTFGSIRSPLSLEIPITPHGGVRHHGVMVSVLSMVSMEICSAAFTVSSEKTDFSC